MARRALGAATLKLVQAISSALGSSTGPILVACSGGPDSLALAAAAIHVAKQQQVNCGAVIVDHGLQQGSEAIADRAAAQLGDLGYLDVIIRPVEVGARGLGPEGAAREARYGVLAAEADTRGAVVLLGHTLDDQAETVLLGLSRGSGTRSLAGMADRVGIYRRPLLGLRRSDTERACRELGLTPWHDPHNSDSAYSRSRLRHTVLPLLEQELGPGVAEALARTAQVARDDADLLDQLAEETQLLDDTLDCVRLAATPAALRRRVIKSWLAIRGATAVTYGHVLAVEALVTDWHGQKGITVPGLVVVRDFGQLTSVAG